MTEKTEKNPKGAGAPKGNKNNLKGDEVKSSFIHCRVTPTEKSSWVRAAQKEGMKLCEWIARNNNRHI